MQRDRRRDCRLDGDVFSHKGFDRRGGAIDRRDSKEKAKRLVLFRLHGLAHQKVELQRDPIENHGSKEQTCACGLSWTIGQLIAERLKDADAN
ncbi:hypothetical protein ZIOFF_035296 [Zingiber officinale]|uniref:Uncharacterized protein n=1 Tax=Zingiber officinale TaxID=94328 RepID=A0A8J5L2K0_ZINOF|nr:hypothetical protein ZIOFF_035296 [Zingiber officinale]